MITLANSYKIFIIMSYRKWLVFNKHSAHTVYHNNHTFLMAVVFASSARDESGSKVL